MNTPNQLSDTPRTDAAWAKTFLDDDDQCRAGNAATDMRDECATLERELAALAAERDQLRAQNDQFSDNLSAVGAVYNAEKTRAERAEAEAERYRLVTLRQDAELATERARLDWLQEHALAQHSEGISISKLGKHYNGFPGSLRAAIDAAMKGEA